MATGEITKREAHVLLNFLILSSIFLNELVATVKNYSAAKKFQLKNYE